MMRIAALWLCIVGGTLTGCDWASFGDDDADADGGADGDADADADGDADADPPVVCGQRVCVLGGGIRTLGGTALAAGGLVLHEDGPEGLGRSCAGRVCIEGGLEP